MKQYIVTDTLKNIVIKLNNKPWSIENSFGIDTSIFIKIHSSNFYSTSTLTKYSIIAPYTTVSDTLTTAGEYSDLLNNYLTLAPGDYICQLVSFDIKHIDGSKITIKPFIIVPVEINENIQSAFVGEFEVQVN